MMKTLGKWMVLLLSIPVLFSCGKSNSSATLSISGPASISVNTCTAYTITRSSAVSTLSYLGPGITSGQGGVYTDNACTSIAIFDVTMAAGATTATFYYSSSTATSATLSVSDITNTTDTAGTLSVTVH